MLNLSQQEADALYHRIGELLGTVPDFSSERAEGPLSQSSHMWLARAYACADQILGVVEASSVKTATQVIVTQLRTAVAVQTLLAVLYRAFATLELKVSPGLQGSYIPVGDSFAALQAITSVLRHATTDAFVVDPYLDGSFLTTFGNAVPETVPLRLMTEAESRYLDNLREAVRRWQSSFQEQRPIEVRLAPRRSLHDRLIMLDRSKVWVAGQSFKDFANRSPTTVLAASHDISIAKINAFSVLWEEAEPIAG